MTHASLFSGIGGFDLAAEWMGWENVFHCEWNPFGQKILKHYWPNSELFTDITKSDFKKYANTIDILTGGFPCQPYSAAGKRLGKEDERHLWPEMLRVIREVAPRYVVGENVRGLTNWNGGMVFDEVCTDLENLGYQVAPFIIPACAVNAPHKRERVWFIAYSDVRRGCGEKGFGKYDLRRGERKEQNNHLEPPNTRLEQWVANGNASDTDGNGNGSKHQLCSGGNVPQECVNQSRNATDADGVRQFEREREYEEHADQRGVNALNDLNANAGEGNATDTDRGGMAGYRPIDKNGGFQTNECNQNNSKKQPRMGWQKFPTQPPICSGDDGISSELDGITFPKWRNESIKAYGNAVVPQVVYEIFKAIEKYENL